MYARKYYLIYYPIRVDVHTTSGGPYCIRTSNCDAYVAFNSTLIAEYFLHKRNDSSEGHEFIQICDLGLKYPELRKDVGHILPLSSEESVDHLVNDYEAFPYNEYLIHR